MPARATSDSRCATVLTGQSTLLCPRAPHLLHVPLKNLFLPAQSGFFCPFSPPHGLQYPSKYRCLTDCSPLPLPSCLFLSPLFLLLPLPLFTLPPLRCKESTSIGTTFEGFVSANSSVRGSAQAVIEQLSHMTQLRRFLPHLHMQVCPNFFRRSAHGSTSPFPPALAHAGMSELLSEIGTWLNFAVSSRTCTCRYVRTSFGDRHMAQLRRFLPHLHVQVCPNFLRRSAHGSTSPFPPVLAHAGMSELPSEIGT